MTGTDEVRVRRAVPGDEEEILRLRHVMATAVFGFPMPALDEPNHVAAVKKLRSWLEDGDQTVTACFVIDALDGNGLAATAVGAVDERLPSERNPSGRCGYIYGVCTEERYRRRGYSRLVVQALLDWYADQGIPRVELHASEFGEGLYRELGFEEPKGVALTRWATLP
ncbi:GCN5-related N-acetyltransferase [Catenulispora acidiphila DSM 44928]|uniref:GCN5-related N-acetyltransferase n=1 Tax=Catenulispora acidiphila (strain DSM 44928 / JCM 14897 / NBRC 102108 / NRRL B-24433 / ID139908) TaxID=479433 RepID=C7QKJ9_CATAD|nr:GNAT family N-acetyltransferase [Catenulispora acidiphila]ACU77098.1 GCN5-related N-acetyltransferase [Catenulispora acidiphila DSM 44928]